MTERPSHPLPTEEVDRREFREDIGIHNRTLQEWIAQGVVTPRKVLRNSRWIQMFSPADVRLGRQIRLLQERHHGRFKLVDYAAFAKGAKPIPEHSHDPARLAPPWPSEGQ